ncbi:MAG: GNAT family N-acetyltransferase [Chloroflexi bacterium]|nr:GNAT family N-acetyltransferase [Chloroflexota bacterium]
MLINAQATAEHAAHFAQLAQIAGDQLFSQLFGSRATPLLQGMFLREDNEFSCYHCAFIRHEGEIAGMIHAYSATTSDTYQLRGFLLMLRLAGWELPRFLLMLALMRQLLGFLGQRLSPGDYYIAFVALYPAFRGRGLSKALLAHAEESALRGGCSRLALDVAADNAIAISAYQRVGFAQVAASPILKHNGKELQMLRLAKDLSRPAPAR